MVSNKKMSNVLLRNNHALIMQDNLENPEIGEKKPCRYESVTLKASLPNEWFMIFHFSIIFNFSWGI